MKTSIEIAKEVNMKHILEIAKNLGLTEDDIDQYGKYKAKLSLDILEKNEDKNGKLILVTAINPTPAGEGKSTTTIGLAQGFKRIGKDAVVALREPSLGPVFGVKGGAAGGGYAQVVPMEDINLHFTGDMHAITSANNLLSAAIDNHIHQGNHLNIDIRRITFKRVMDMNDRALRETIVALGGKINGFPREDGFNITVASEIMAILCLSMNLQDLKRRIGSIIIGYNLKGEPVYARELQVEGAMTLLMKDAIKPNLVQTLENTPAIIHGGPFANIAHGCNSILATKMAMKLSNYAITEAGFGADLGAEKFFDIKCRYGGISPDCAVLVATVRALKYNGEALVKDLEKEDIKALEKGMENLKGHIENIKKYGVPMVVAINRFHTDTEKELKIIEKTCEEIGISVSLSEVFAKGGEGGEDLAKKVIEVLENKPSDFKVLYEMEDSIEEKINKIAKEIYGAKKVNILPKAKNMIKTIEEFGLDKLPICIAKNQYSFSDNPKLLGRPKDFEISVREITISNGAGFIVAITGDIMTMPGLPKIPAANKMDIDEKGKITGLF